MADTVPFTSQVQEATRSMFEAIQGLAETQVDVAQPNKRYSIRYLKRPMMSCSSLAEQKIPASSSPPRLTW
jgi:hypothetical protein